MDFWSLAERLLDRRWPSLTFGPFQFKPSVGQEKLKASHSSEGLRREDKQSFTKFPCCCAMATGRFRCRSALH